MYFKVFVRSLKVSWVFVLLYLKASFYKELLFLLKNKYLFFEVFFLFDNFLDSYTLIAVKRFLISSGLTYKNLLSPNSTLAFSNYIPNDFLLTNDLLILVGLNLRITFPILNTRIRNLVIKSNLLVYVLDNFCSYNYYTYNLKNDSLELLNFLSGKH
jgi:hypothetical protein